MTASTDTPCKKPHRKDLKPGEVLCTYCPAKCCRYFALPIDRPTEWKDFEYMRWFLMHDKASVFVEDGTWYILVHTKCKNLRDDNLCGIYETRPQICRDYTTKNCEYEDSWVYDHYFETPEQVEEYAEALLGEKNNKPFRTPKPSKLMKASR